MGNEVVDLLRQTTVKVLDRSGNVLGSGFFIAKGLVLTAAHVVAEVDHRDIRVRWGDGQPMYATCVMVEPPTATPGVDVYPAPDLAVLFISAAVALDHPCAMLSESVVGEPMLAHGYTKGTTVPQATPDVVRLEYEGTREEPGGVLLKCRNALVDPGMSGAPLLDLTSGCVVGVVKAQRSATLPVGLYASSVSNLMARRGDLWATSQLFHRTDRRWQQAIEPGNTVRDPQVAARAILNATVAGLRRRGWNLPPLCDRAALHQTIWVSRVARSNSHASVSDRDLGVVTGHFRWRPLRTVGKVTVVRGKPGYGKSWLLAHHAESLASDSLASLEAGLATERLRLPLLLDCATFSARLPDNPDDDDVIEALLRSAGLPGTPTALADDCRIMTRDAYRAGQLVLCLDGLDEVPARFQLRIKQALGNVAASANAMLIATRHSALGLLNEMTSEGRVDIETLGFTTREASKFIAVWLDHDADRRAVLERALESSEALRNLASVPLLLSFLCRLADQPERSESFPTSKGPLYQEVVESLLAGRWRAANREAADPNSPREPVRRMHLLADALGDLMDSWRFSGESISWADLSARLTRHPDHGYLKTAAIARWEAWQRASGAEPATPPPDPVIWELIFDGLLIPGDDSAGEQVLHVLHPSLKDFLLATFLARLDREGWRAALERHRWFDSAWQEIFALAASLMADDSDALIQEILKVDADPWYTQALFAANCVAASAGKISDTTVERVVRALLDPPSSVHASDTRRRFAGFAHLVRAGVRLAVAKAVEICEAGSADQPELRLEATCALAESGHELGIDRARELLSTARLPRRFRERLITALSAAEDPAALEIVAETIESSYRRGDLEAFLTALKPQSAVLRHTAVRLLRTRRFVETARASVAKVLLECGDDATAEVFKAANDITLELGLRCQLFTLLIDANVPDAVRHAMSLLRNPSVRAVDASFVIEAMLRDRELSAVSTAARMLLDTRLSHQRRVSLAAAVCDLGADGITLLRQQLGAGLPLELTVCHLTALIQARDEGGLEFAVQISSGLGVPVGIRGTIVVTLLQTEPSLVQAKNALEIVGDPRLAKESVLRLATEMAKAGFPDAVAAVRAAMARSEARAVVDWPQASRLLAASGAVGRRALIALVSDANQSWTIRIESVLALASAQRAGDVREALSWLDLATVPDLWRIRLIFQLAIAGQSHLIDELIGFLTVEAAAYDVFHEFLQGPNAALGDFEDNYQELCAAMVKERTPEKLLTMDDDTLAEFELSYPLKSQRDAALRWLYNTLEQRVGHHLIEWMLPDQLATFDTLIDDNDEVAANEWLSTTFPEHRAAVRYQLALLIEDVRARRLKPPEPAQEPGTDRQRSTLQSMRIILGALDELIELSPGWSRYFLFLEQHQSTLLTEAAERILLVAADLDPGWPLHEGHLFVVRHARRNTVLETAKLLGSPDHLHDHCLALLDDRSFMDLHLAGAAWVLRHRNTELGRFYAALGAELEGRHRMAVHLMDDAGAACLKRQSADLLTQIRDLGARFEVKPQNVEELLDSFSSGLTRSGDVESHRVRGDELARSGRWAEALDSYGKAVERAPRRGDLHHSRGMMLGCLGRWEESVEAYDAALEISSDTATWGNRGESLIMLGRLDEAESSLRMALEVPGATDFEAKVLLALLVSGENSAEAGELCEAALHGQVNGVSQFRRAELSAIAFTLLGDLDKAEHVLRSAATSHVVLDILERPLYELLAQRSPAGAERLLAVWAEISPES